MGTIKFDKAVEVLREYGKDIIFTNDLRNLIIRKIGGDENRTIFPTLKMMREMGIIKEVKINKWKINLPEN